MQGLRFPRSPISKEGSTTLNRDRSARDPGEPGDPRDLNSTPLGTQLGRLSIPSTVADDPMLGGGGRGGAEGSGRFGHGRATHLSFDSTTSTDGEEDRTTGSDGDVLVLGELSPHIDALSPSLSPCTLRSPPRQRQRTSFDAADATTPRRGGGGGSSSSSSSNSATKSGGGSEGGRFRREYGRKQHQQHTHAQKRQQHQSHNHTKNGGQRRGRKPPAVPFQLHLLTGKSSGRGGNGGSTTGGGG